MAVVIKGLFETQAALRRFVEEASQLENANKDLGSKIANRATAIVPQRTGRLASSIGNQPIEGGVQIYAGNDSVPYAGVIEYGWPQKGRAAKPYLMPAVEEYVGEITKSYENNIQQIIGKYNLQ